MKLVLDCCIFSSGKIYLAMRHSRAVTARAAGADGKEVPTREVVLRFVVVVTSVRNSTRTLAAAGQPLSP